MTAINILLYIQLVFHIGPFWHYRARLPILRGFFYEGQEKFAKTIEIQFNNHTPTAKVFDSNMTLEKCISTRFSLQKPIRIQVINIKNSTEALYFQLNKNVTNMLIVLNVQKLTCILQSLFVWYMI